ncbi:MORC family CW-type zinc finger protein 3a isoform X2 [Betta splendens]|uniref:MORC family CW-type zinc finger protein 3a isoform X2 n=1 Tax=Betta splendens TaxID=158456 RepID=A0A6P7LGN2_BETSP|nr:MORC family CW-type zinc finger protein 3a isoform X2 [Betta splendens]
MAAAANRGVPYSTLCPKFLHTNSTSHTWPFSAIAELIDNAYDPDVSAKQFWIDKTMIKKEECLSFMDNGNGLDYETIHKMLSFGYSDKAAVNGVQPIGIYGNGFKSGSMRLGKDAIVFSKSKSTACVGMLSQTYLEKIGATQIIVPIVCFEQTRSNQFFVKDKYKASLQDILSYSPFTTQEELITELNAISHPSCPENTGTRIIIWSLRRTTNGMLEFDFVKDRYDVRIPDDVCEAMKNSNQNPDRAASYIPESVYSLRAYCSILYLKPRMQVVIRGQKVKSQLIAKSLASRRKDYYKPVFLDKKKITITFGYNTKNKEQYGIMMYHKNRLIKAYEHVGCQLKANNQGVGVIGVIECNFLDPTHNKQSFIESDKYRKTMSNLGTKLEEYWKEMRYTWNSKHPNSTITVEDAMKRPDQNWVQCDQCLQWRKLPDGIDCNKLPDKWFCYMNPNPQFRSCSVQQELEDSDDEQTTNRKTYKLKEKENKEKERQREEAARKHQEQQRLAALSNKKHITQQKEKLKWQLQQTTMDCPSTSQTPRFTMDSVQGGAARAESTPLTSSIISQAAFIPSSYSGLPVITDVCSLSPDHQRGKRAQPVTPQTTPKRPRVNILQQLTSGTPSSVNVSPLPSPSMPADHNSADDDIVILETLSTPKPKKPDYDLNKVKTENQQSDRDVGMVMECTDDAAVEVKLETNVSGTSSAGSPAAASSPSPVPPTEQTSATTQTEVLQVKKEENDQTQTEERAGQSTSNKDALYEKQEGGTLQKGVKDPPESDDAVWEDTRDNQFSPPHHASITEVQQQQDQLLQMMQETAQERDSFKEQVTNLTCQLKDMERKLQELSQVSVKKECDHQETQTEETMENEGGGKYKIMLEKAKKKIEELIEEKHALLAATGRMASTNPGEETDDLALQLDRLLRELDQTNKEKDDLLAQISISQIIFSFLLGFPVCCSTSWLVWRRKEQTWHLSVKTLD